MCTSGWERDTLYASLPNSLLPPTSPSPPKQPPCYPVHSGLQRKKEEMDGIRLHFPWCLLPGNSGKKTHSPADIRWKTRACWKEGPVISCLCLGVLAGTHQGFYRSPENTVPIGKIALILRAAILIKSPAIKKRFWVPPLGLGISLRLFSNSPQSHKVHPPDMFLFYGFIIECKPFNLYSPKFIWMWFIWGKFNNY